HLAGTKCGPTVDECGLRRTRRARRLARIGGPAIPREQGDGAPTRKPDLDSAVLDGHAHQAIIRDDDMEGGSAHLDLAGAGDDTDPLARWERRHRESSLSVAQADDVVGPRPLKIQLRVRERMYRGVIRPQLASRCGPTDSGRVRRPPGAERHD